MGELENKNILIIDDDDISMLLLTTYLERSNANVFEAKDGCVAIKMLKEQEFDTILIDMQMPRITGEETVKIIREDLKSDIPIIMITAYTEEFIKDIKGIDGFIIKPFNSKILMDKIKSNLK